VTTHPYEPKDAHAVHSDRLLDHAARMIEEGDRVQACEKIWGSVSHRIREIAYKRGWPVKANADYRDVARYVAQETGDEALQGLGEFQAYHVNFYEDTMDEADIREGLEKARRACAGLDAANAALDDSQPPPHGPAFRSYERRHSLAPNPPYSAEEWAEHCRRQDRLAERAKANATRAGFRRRTRIGAR